MKKVLFLISALLIIGSGIVFAATQGTDSELFGSYFASFASLVGAVPFVTEFLRGLFKLEGGIGIQIISWLTGVALAFIGWGLGLGMFVGMIWWHVLVIGVGASLAANGFFDTGIVLAILKALGIMKKQ